MTSHEMAEPSTADRQGGCPLNKWHTLAACFLGYLFNAMDVLLFEPAMEAMARAGHPINITKTEAVSIATATLLTSAGGGWLAGWLSDWFSRKITLALMIGVLALFTVACGCVSSFAWLFVCRALMGIGFGGQWAAAAVQVGEAFGKAEVDGREKAEDNRGLWVGVMQMGWAFGWAIAWFGMEPLAKHLHSSILPESVSDGQVMFWAGGLFTASLIPYVLCRVKDSPLITKTRENGVKAGTVDLFLPDRLRTTFLTCMLSIGALCGYWVIMLWLPIFLEQSSFDVYDPFHVHDLGYRIPLVVGAGAGYFASACLSDVGRENIAVSILTAIFILLGIILLLVMDRTRIGGWVFAITILVYLFSAFENTDNLFGRRRNFVLFALYVVVTVFACIHVALAKAPVWLPFVGDINWKHIIPVLAFWLGFFASGAFSGVGAFFTELFPTSMRGIGVGFTYNFGRGFAVLALFLIPVVVQDLASDSMASWLAHGDFEPWMAPLLADEARGQSIGMFVLVSYALMIIAAVLLPETLGFMLRLYDREPGPATAADPAQKQSS